MSEEDSWFFCVRRWATSLYQVATKPQRLKWISRRSKKRKGQNKGFRVQALKSAPPTKLRSLNATRRRVGTPLELGDSYICT